MEANSDSILKNIDWKTIFIYLALITIGWINIYAAVYDESSNAAIFDFTRQYGKQLIWIMSSALLAIFILFIDPKIFSHTAYFVYGIALFLLFAVLVMATATKGARSWFGFGDFGIQPSEFAKFATALALAKYLGNISVDMKTLKTQLMAAGIFMLPCMLIFLQNDTGSALVFFAFFIVLFREGLSGKILLIPLFLAAIFISTFKFGEIFVIIGISAIILGSIYFLKKKNLKNILRRVFILIGIIGIIFTVNYVYENVLAAHQKTRIDVLLGKIDDLKGVGYNVNQSKIAIGSGGFFGKGFLNGTQTKFNFVPEQSTDFIFCTIGEEWGFIGSAITIGLFIWLLIHLITLAERQRSAFSRVYGYSVACILFFHFFVNIGMAIGILPVIGIPLPFISYGGSSLWSFTILLFIFIRQDASRNKLV